MKKQKIKIGIIGFGNIGKKRFKSLLKLKDFNFEIVYIVDTTKPKTIKNNINFFYNWRQIKNINVDLIIVSTPTEVSKMIVRNLCHKFNILVEKPLTNKFSEIQTLTRKSIKNNKILKVGYNLRFDDGLILAKEFLEKKCIGKIYYAKITYANGAAKTNTNKVGSLLDMGIHAINLLIWLTNDNNFKIISNLSQKNEFMKKGKVDNGFIFLKSKNIISTIHHGFCTWKNKFYIELSGSKGFVRINSLSKWKNQIVSFGKRSYPDGIPKIKKWIFSDDNSWKNEIKFVINNILHNNKKKLKEINLENYNTFKIIKNII